MKKLSTVDLKAKSQKKSEGRGRAGKNQSKPLGRPAFSGNAAQTRAVEAQKRAEKLRAVNEGLEAEVSRRKATEKSLRESKRRQSRLLANSRSMQEQLRLLSHQVLHVQEEERKFISRELYDEIAQSLAAINFHLSSLAGDSAADTGRMQKKIRETQRLVEQSVESVHRFAAGLRPTMLDDLGLIPVLRACAKEFTKQTNLPVLLDLPDDLKPLADGPAVSLYRVACAALSNAARHAKATEVRLAIRETKRVLRMEIAHNGKALEVTPVHSVKMAHQLGLVGMREQTEMVGGRFSFSSTEGKGTTVSVRLPVSKAYPPPLKTKE